MKAKHTDFINEFGLELNFAALEYEDQIWIMEDVKKIVDKHINLYYDEAEQYFIFNRKSGGSK